MGRRWGLGRRGMWKKMGTKKMLNSKYIMYMYIRNCQRIMFSNMHVRTNLIILGNDFFIVVGWWNRGEGRFQESVSRLSQLMNGFKSHTVCTRNRKHIVTLSRKWHERNAAFWRLDSWQNNELPRIREAVTVVTRDRDKSVSLMSPCAETMASSWWRKKEKQQN